MYRLSVVDMSEMNKMGMKYLKTADLGEIPSIDINSDQSNSSCILLWSHDQVMM